MNWNRNIAHVQPLTEPITAQITVPGSKSYTNRALIIASLTKGRSTLKGCSNANDSLLLIKLLRQLDIDISVDEDTVIVNGNGGKFKEFHGKLNVQDAGTVMRFLTALCCLVPGEIILEGTKRMNQRPINGLVDALLQLGANITYLGEPSFPPLKIRGNNLKGGKVNIDASHSSQFISALLMIAPLLDSYLEIIVNEEIASAPYIDMTISVMNYLGVSIGQKAGNYFIKEGSAYTAQNYTIEGDTSSASYFFALAAITQSYIRVERISPVSLQGDVKFADFLEQMGCKVLKGKNYIEVTGSKELRAINADMKDMPDIAPTLAVVAAFAKGTTILRGLKNLEIKETKRLSALQNELTKMDIDCSSDGEQLSIHGGNPKGTMIQTYNDHRMAMAFAIAGARLKDLYIESPEVVKKSFPRFWDTLKEIGVKIDIVKNEKNIVLIGFMGAGKTTVGRLLAKELQLPLLETDDEITKRSGISSINEIFETKGESFFRELEKEVISDCARQSNCIISCGGGIINSSGSMEGLKKKGTIIFLSASFETISSRLKSQNSRPLFEDKEKAKELYLQRLPLYKNYADEIILTDNLTPEKVTESIVSKILALHAR